MQISQFSFRLSGNNQTATQQVGSQRQQLALVKQKQQQLVALRDEASKGTVTQAEVEKRLAEINALGVTSGSNYTKQGQLLGQVGTQLSYTSAGKVKISSGTELLAYLKSIGNGR